MLQSTGYLIEIISEINFADFTAQHTLGLLICTYNSLHTDVGM